MATRKSLITKAYHHRRRSRQTRVVVWIDNDDVAWLDRLPCDRSAAIRAAIAKLIGRRPIIPVQKDRLKPGDTGERPGR